MVEFGSIERHQMMDIVQTYPWFAAMRAELCMELCRENGMEGARGMFVESLPYLPDSAYVFRALHSMEEGDFKDAELVQVQEEAAAQTDGTQAVKARPRIHIPGSDFFSKEDYESEKSSEDDSLSRMAVVDYSAPAPENSSSKESGAPFQLISETLAEIYANQGYPEVAKEIYRKLSLENPEKNAYFASLIDKLK